MKVDSFIHGVTIPIRSKFEKDDTTKLCNGIGFFYHLMKMK